MKKADFLNEFYYYLGSLTKLEKEEIMTDFREHFREGAEAGKTEEQICQELGTPFECAKQYVGDTIIPRAMEKKQNRRKNFWTAALIFNIIQAFISIPVTFGLFVAAAIMIVAFCFIVPVVASTAFLVFAISSTSAVVCLAIVSLLWTIVEIKECIDRINK